MPNNHQKKNSLKIALVYDAIFPFVKGGAEKRFYEIGQRLAKDGYDVHLYGMKFWNGPKVIQFEGMTLHGICKAMPLYTASGRRSILQSLWFGINSFKLWREKFDVMDCCGFPYFSLFPCRLITWMRRKPLYTTWHEVWGKEYWKKYLGKLGFIGYAVERIAVKLPNIIISISNHTKDNIQKKLGRNKNIVIIPNGVDFNEIENSAPSKIMSDVIFVGRLLENKNVDVLLRSVQILKERNLNLSLIIVGDGPESEKLKNIANQLGIKNNVNFFGFIEKQSELYGIMRTSKVLVLPSNREGFGMVAVEANACGLQVITIDHKNNATRDLIINGENGMLCALDKDELANAIEITLRDRKKPEFYKNYAIKYGWGKICSKIKDIYKI